MTDPKDPFEERLREALRSGSEGAHHPGADDSRELLDRIHRGAARRRARRRAGGLVAAAVLATVFLVTLPLVAPPPSGDQTAQGPAVGSRPSVSPGDGAAKEERRRQRPAYVLEGDLRVDAPTAVRAGVRVAVDDVKVTSVSGTDGEEFWVSGYGECGGDRVCNVLGHSGDGGADVEFLTLPGSGYSMQTTVRFTPDGETGWATDGGQIYRTDSAGESWIRLKQPDNVRVSELEVWEDEVWAVGSEPATQDTVVLASDRGSQRLVPVQRSRALDTVNAVAFGSRSFGIRRLGSELNLAHTSDGGQRWADTAIGCSPADVSAAEDVAWVLCENENALVRSVDQGRTWLPPEPLDPAVFEPPSKVAAINADTAFVAGSGRAWVIESQVATEADGIGDGSYAYAEFTSEDVGYLVGSDGHLCRTDDGGYTWERVELP
jgi:hypothetical protein